ncbi:unnamed protein product [Gongylonema pulchrum]|uniref:Ras-GAP domain-containing protein n=1 Tax=Gongylonema pulchrum TaxID=637853 RepID=A0A183EEF6_9BILA|nr:unnamed protein product [Gongylonema pulchrum]
MAVAWADTSTAVVVDKVCRRSPGAKYCLTHSSRSASKPQRPITALQDRREILINSLRCFLLLLKFPLPALRTNMPKFLDRLFIFLADYTAFTTAGHAAEYAQNSLEVSQLVFKAFTQIIKDAPNFLLTAKRLQLLLTYAETDVFDSQKQAVAFPLIKAIIIRKLQDPKVCPVDEYGATYGFINNAEKTISIIHKIVLAMCSECWR